MSVELANTAAWLDTLYGRCEKQHGELVFIAASRNKIHSVCDLEHMTLVDAAKTVVGKPGLYVKINPMNYAAMKERGKKERKSVVGGIAEVQTIVSLHIDVDAGKSSKYVTREHALWAIDQMPHKPTLIANSNGDKGGFHCYWCLAEPYRIPNTTIREKINVLSTEWNKRLKTLCSGKLDSTGNIDRVLRVFGGKRTDGGVVSLHSYEPTNLYKLKDFVL